MKQVNAFSGIKYALFSSCFFTYSNIDLGSGFNFYNNHNYNLEGRNNLVYFSMGMGCRRCFIYPIAGCNFERQQ